MKILVITDLYPVNENEKDTPRTIYDFVQGWKNLGHEVSVVKPNFLVNSFLRKKPFYQNGTYGDVTNLNYWTPFWWNVKTKLNQNLDSYNLIIAHMPSALLFADKLSLPFVAGVHNSDLEVLTSPMYAFHFRKKLSSAYKNAYKIACRSEVLRNKFLEIFPQYESKTFVAYSGVAPNIITKKVWQKKEKYQILTCAKLIKRKNIDKVILACEKLNNVDLTVIGDGEEMYKLKKLSSKPKFIGHIEKPDVIKKMRESDIFILPSQNETFGMVYLEAMASGCVTVGLKNDGIDGILKDGFNGFLTEKNEIVDVLLKIMNSDNTTILNNAYNTIQNYTIEKACLNYLNNVL